MSALSAEVHARVGALELDVALQVGPRGLFIVGPNGAGKTSTLLALLGVRRPSRGRIAVDDDVLYDHGAGVDVPPERRRLAYVPQDYGLFPHLTAEQNVAFALEALSPRPGAAWRRDRARALLEALSATHVAALKPAALSGGERQRVALARALAIEPRALLFDEPFAALDVEARADVRAFLRAELARLGRPFVVVTHDPQDVEAFDGPLLVLERGRVVQQGERAAVMAAPATAFVAKLFATATPART